ncbi:MAG: hypothetical protein QOE70_2065 [Chthoniobacter sp.]|jgi:hypothetical protein|nr:hypothetical protein [Chthoniobacter sp.]
MKAGEGGGESLIIAAQAAKASGPGKGALDDPAAGQENKATFGFLGRRIG